MVEIRIRERKEQSCRARRRELAVKWYAVCLVIAVNLNRQHMNQMELLDMNTLDGVVSENCGIHKFRRLRPLMCDISEKPSDIDLISILYCYRHAA